MFWRFPTEESISRPYISIPSCEGHLVRFIYGSKGSDIDDEVSLRDLLIRSVQGEDAVSSFIFESARHRGLFIVCTAPFGSHSTNGLDDAVAIFNSFIENSKARATCAAFSMKREKHGREVEEERHTSLAIISRYDEETVSSLGVTGWDQESVAALRIRYRGNRGFGFFEHRVIPFNAFFHIFRSNSRASCYFVATTTCLLLVLVFIFSFINMDAILQSHSPNKYQTWRAYDTAGSIGPDFQLSLTATNVTDFTNLYVNNSSEWFLRIDDQALVPAHLVSAEEQKYQAWFQMQYPNLNAIRVNQSYLSPVWLDSVAVDQVQVDDMFHFSHCVLALRRFIRAKEVGRHVCGRDIDNEHMQHCLNALDWWAFPSGGRTNSFPNPERPFWWRTKVCFD